MGKNGRGKYLYCIIGTAQPVEFPFAGINGGKDLHTIHAGELAAVVSDSEADTYRFTRATAMAHLSVIQQVMREFTVLPFSFGTVAESEEGLTELLTRYHQEFLSQLQHLEGKAEYGLKALWQDSEQPFKETLAEREDIRRYRDALVQRPPAETYQERIRLGQMVLQALEAKREAECQRIVERLRPLAVEVRVNPAFMDQMLLNAAFLLVRDAEPGFAEALDTLDREYGGRVRFRLVGPSPPFNFVHMPIAWG